jgi:hypothetical protein
VLKLRLHWIVPLVYASGAVPVWVSFAAAPPDGLANIWLVIYTLPVVVLCTFGFGMEFPYFPGSYYLSHTVYFVTVVALLSACMFFGLRRLSRRKA